MLRGRDRLIVALDVDSQSEAMWYARELKNVRFFKYGLRLMLAGRVLDLIESLRDERGAYAFLDIKWGGDIGNTVADFVRDCSNTGAVRFVSLVGNSVETMETLRAAAVARKPSGWPHFLMVPTLSSLEDANNHEILKRSIVALQLGCDGLVLSGKAIKACRSAFGGEIDIVSPGIRPEGSPAGDHKRLATPSEAIAMGADYLVVGRPIIEASDPRQAAQDIMDEIDRALEAR